MRRTTFTYGQLDRVLRSLGFSRSLVTGEPPAVQYAHEESGAFISVPPYPHEDMLFDHHLALARVTVDNFGLAEPEEFDARLQHVRERDSPPVAASAFPGGFNPAIDRHDPRSAARLFRWLWPDPAVARVCAVNLASSIRTAHAVAEGSWSVTMHAESIRLNVGQVETLTLFAETSRFLFRAPLELDSTPFCEVQLGANPVYRAVPIPSGVCLVDCAEIASLSSAVRTAHDAYITAAATYKRGSPFKHSFSPSVVEHLEGLLGESLPRPSYLTAAGSIQVRPLADELDEAAPIREGAKYQITVNAYERDPRARMRCIAHHGCACAICGFVFGEMYGEVAEGFIHVHHLHPLSGVGQEHEVDPVADLRPVCPNCHAVLHLRTPPYSIEEVRSFLTNTHGP